MPTSSASYTRSIVTRKEHGAYLERAEEGHVPGCSTICMSQVTPEPVEGAAPPLRRRAALKDVRGVNSNSRTVVPMCEKQNSQGVTFSSCKRLVLQVAPGPTTTVTNRRGSTHMIIVFVTRFKGARHRSTRHPTQPILDTQGQFPFASSNNNAV